MPDINKLQESYNDAGLKVIFLSYDDRETQAGFFNAINITGIKGYIADDLGTPYPRYVFPATILIDAEGRIRDAWLGSLGFEETEKRINLLLPQSERESGSSLTGYIIGGISAIFLILIFIGIRRMK
jgi:peroxiredoxin